MVLIKLFFRSLGKEKRPLSELHWDRKLGVLFQKWVGLSLHTGRGKFLFLLWLCDAKTAALPSLPPVNECIHAGNPDMLLQEQGLSRPHYKRTFHPASHMCTHWSLQRTAYCCSFRWDYGLKWKIRTDLLRQTTPWPHGRFLLATPVPAEEFDTAQKRAWKFKKAKQKQVAWYKVVSWRLSSHCIFTITL